MVKLSEVQNMFWGVTLDVGKVYTQTVERGFHISMAALEPSSNNDKLKQVSVMINHDKAEFLLCTLGSGRLLQQPLDLNFTEGEEVTFFVKGEGVIHLTGYLVEDDMPEGEMSFDEDDFSSEESSEEEEVPQLKRVIMAAEDSEDDDDDDDYQEIATVKRKLTEKHVSKKKAKLSVDDDEDDEDEDDEDDDEDDGEDDDEDDDMDSDMDSDDVDDFLDNEAEEDSDMNADDSDDELDSGDEDENLARMSGSFIQAAKKDKTPKAPKEKESSKKVKKVKKGETPKAEKSKDTPNKKGKGKSESPKVQEKSTSEKKKKKKTAMTNGDDTPQKSKPGTPSGEKSPGKGAKGNKRILEGGIVCEDIKEGHGPPALHGKRTHMYYTGRLLSGKIFDLKTSGTPFKFGLGKGEVIRGWDIGVKGMKVGGKRKLTIPAALAYGNKRAGSIPPNSTLVFDVELKNVT